MTQSRTLKVLIAAIEKISDFEGPITEATTLPEIQLDSIDYVSIQLDVKRELGIEINYDDFKSGEILCVGDFVRYLDERLARSDQECQAQQ